jgi:hypothetical protein
LGKALAAFLSIPYENRGRQNLTEEEAWLVVVEDHGDPHGLVRRSQGIEEKMTFRLSLEPKRVHLKKIPATVTGEQEKAMPIARFFGLDWSRDPAPKRTVAVTSGQIDFIDEGEVVFRLKLC